MLEYHREYLWKNFVETYKFAEHISQPDDYRLNSWTKVEETSDINTWLCASYLFDSSENAEAIAEDFKDIVEKYRPNRVLLLTSSQPNKREFCDTVADQIIQSNYSNHSTSFPENVLRGQLKKLYQFRQQISEKHNLDLTGIPTWEVYRLYSRILSNAQLQLGLDFD